LKLSFSSASTLLSGSFRIFDKYLYVGATRAATYLGLTCDGPQLPAKIQPLEALFGKTWKLPA
jgi:hypothetical protein